MILIAFGTRPEWIKLKPLIDKIENRIPYRLICTGQHKELLDSSTSKYNIIKLEINEGNNRLDNIIASILLNSEPLFKDVKYSLVQGDTTSAFAVALASFNRKIPIIHLEAGLRSWDFYNPYPEEFNRISITNMASIHLCPTESNELNIKLGDNKNSKTFVVGNTVLDNLKDINPSINNQVLITMHRRENLAIIDKWFHAINKLAIHNPDLEFIFPMHLNPEIQKYKHILTNITVTNPLNHNKFIDMLSKCGLVITDSGGIQEEAAFLKKKSIVCRQNTERNEGEGVFSYMCWSPDNLDEIFNQTKIELVNNKCPYGDGCSSEKILKILLEEYYAIDAS